MTMGAFKDPDSDRGRRPSVGYLPLYQQVRDLLVRRLADGEWQPGKSIPSEYQLARELGVSQGTVRKALDALASEHLLVRQQGRGTFVAEIDEQHILFHFFKLRADDGAQRFPTSQVIDVTVAPAGIDERELLALGEGDEVVRIRRLRSLAGETMIFEEISLPGTIFGTFATCELPNNLYGLYASKFGVTVAQVSERLKAVVLEGQRAALLQVAERTPALKIDRIAWDLEARPVEWRVSYCLTERFHYYSDTK
jgi:GntR family transcriptional regulator